AAALLDGELDPGIVADAREVEVELLPRARDLRTACSCPDDVDPCKHAAAVCYLVADALDTDPFVLLLLRGRRRDEVLVGVRARRARDRAPDGGTTGDDGGGGTSGDGSDPVGAGVDPAEAWAREPG